MQDTIGCHSALHVAQLSPQSSPLRDELCSRTNDSVDKQSIPVPQAESTLLSLGLPVLPESPQQSTDDSSAMDTNDSLHLDITVQDVLPVEENSMEEETVHFRPDCQGDLQQDITYEIIPGSTKRQGKKLFDSLGYSYTVKKTSSSRVTRRGTVHNKTLLLWS